MRLTRYSALVGVVATMALLGACGSDDNNASDNTSAATAAPAAAPTTTAATSSSAATTAPKTSEPATSTEATTEATTASSGGATASDVSVKLSTTPLGDVLVDQDGRTLYLFQKDTPGQPSVCSGGCAAAWPALNATAVPTAGDGIEADDLSLVKNADGTMQVAFYGYPLYYYAEDAAPGDTHGQGVAGVWWVVGADGKPIGAPA